MATPPIDYEAVIADLEAKIVHLQATLAGIRAVAGMTGLGTAPTPGAPSGGGGGNPIVNGKPASDAFLGKSIPEAAKMYLTSQRRKLSTQELMDALEAGGLPGSKYNTVYAILARRENKVGDIVNIKGDWALAEWYPNYVRKNKKDPGSLRTTTLEEAAAAEAGDAEDLEIDPAGEIQSA
jgi:hypothetical protein